LPNILSLTLNGWIPQALATIDALVLEEHQVQLQPEQASAALQLGEEGSEARREWCIALQGGPCVALLVGMQPQETAEEVTEDQATNGEEEETVREPTLADKLYELLGPTDPNVATADT
jgi:hypothetical protein